MHNKLARLKDILCSYDKLAVCFSGGVDSSFLLAVAHECLGDSLVAYTLDAPVYPDSETREAEKFCKERGIRQVMINQDVLSIPGFSSNPHDRCYICKKAMFSVVKEQASIEGISAVAEGTNADDLSDYRPGLKALEELGILSPLKEAGLTKPEIRELSKEMGLEGFSKPSYACLASRFPYGDEITLEKLSMLDNGEEYLRELGLTQVRIRLHDKAARIEVLPSEFDAVMENKDAIYTALQDIGFSYVSLDLQGYRTGSMNEGLSKG